MSEMRQNEPLEHEQIRGALPEVGYRVDPNARFRHLHCSPRAPAVLFSWRSLANGRNVSNFALA
jgi:hypothetical protein